MSENGSIASCHDGYRSCCALFLATPTYSNQQVSACRGRDCVAMLNYEELSTQTATHNTGCQPGDITDESSGHRGVQITGENQPTWLAVLVSSSLPELCARRKGTQTRPYTQAVFLPPMFLTCFAQLRDTTAWREWWGCAPFWWLLVGLQVDGGRQEKAPWLLPRPCISEATLSALRQVPQLRGANCNT